MYVCSSVKYVCRYAHRLGMYDYKLCMYAHMPSTYVCAYAHKLNTYDYKSFM